MAACQDRLPACLRVVHPHPEGPLVAAGDERVVRRLVDGHALQAEALPAVRRLEPERPHARGVAVRRSAEVIVAVAGAGLVHVLLTGEHPVAGHLVRTPVVVEEAERSLRIRAGSRVHPLDVHRRNGAILRAHGAGAGAEADDLPADVVQDGDPSRLEPDLHTR